jgi:hypothetical protein
MIGTRGITVNPNPVPRNMNPRHVKANVSGLESTKAARNGAGPSAKKESPETTSPIMTVRFLPIFRVAEGVMATLME